jgi:hypothetical protein
LYGFNLALRIGNFLSILETNVLIRKMKIPGLQKMKLAAVLFISIFSGVSFAQTYSMESFSQVNENEISRFYVESVRDSNGERLFDVIIRVMDPEAVRPQSMVSRKVSFRARCDSKELTVSLVDIRNIKGQTIKMITVPPGGEEYHKPELGTKEDDWLWKACG